MFLISTEVGLALVAKRQPKSEPKSNRQHLDSCSSSSSPDRERYRKKHKKSKSKKL